MKNKKILLLSVSFLPNIGGLETHLWDYCNFLLAKKLTVYALTLQPIITQAKGKSCEHIKTLTIRRYPWFASGLFLKLVHWPLLEFLYLFPAMLFYGLWTLLKNRAFTVIHAHGLIAGSAAVVLGKLFGKKVVISIHAIYHFPKNGLYRLFSKQILSSSSTVLCLSRQSRNEILGMGLSSKKVKTFTYWVDQKLFKPLVKLKAKKRLGWRGKFVVLFVGRLVPEKGVKELLEAARIADKRILWAIAGEGPLQEEIENQTLRFGGQKSQIPNLVYLGKLDNADLPVYYAAADVLIVPSVHEEGFGRVIIEALSCGLPVIASNRGGIPEAMDNTVGSLIDVTPLGIVREVEKYYHKPDSLLAKSQKATSFAQLRYSERNAALILESYD